MFLKNIKLSIILKITCFFVLAFLFTGCSYRPSHAAYKEMYAHYDKVTELTDYMEESDYFLVFLVEARHLDYCSSNRSLFKTITKHPNDGSKNGDVGHAWIYLQGIVDGEVCVIEGGHSGELGLVQPKYCEGIMNYINYGYADPTPEEKKCPRFEPNPIKYLWASQYDGYFQCGSGRHIPTFAAKINLTEEEFRKVLNFISPNNYYYEDFSITRNQCSSFVAKVGAVVDFPLECELTMPVDPELNFAGISLVMWRDPQYSTITLPSPDIIERSLIEAVCEGRAEYALPWYLNNRKETQFDRFKLQLENVIRFPFRLVRHYCF